MAIRGAVDGLTGEHGLPVLHWQCLCASLSAFGCSPHPKVSIATFIHKPAYSPFIHGGLGPCMVMATHFLISASLVVTQ